MNVVSLFFLLEKEQLCEGSKGGTSIFVSLSHQCWVTDNSRWNPEGEAERRL